MHRAPWGPITAALITVAIVAIAAVVAMFVAGALSIGSGQPDGAASDRATLDTIVVLVVWQATVIGLVLMASAWTGNRASDALGLGRLPTRPELVIASLGLIALVVPYNLAMLLLARDAMLADLRPFSESLLGPSRWPFAAMVCLGAPVAEEMLFRGFALPALARSRLGFWGGATVSTLGWTALHFGYSMVGLLEVFMLGLYFSWVFRQTNNLWVPITIHAGYNALLTLLLMTEVISFRIA